MVRAATCVVDTLRGSAALGGVCANQTCWRNTGYHGNWFCGAGRGYGGATAWEILLFFISGFFVCRRRVLPGALHGGYFFFLASAGGGFFFSALLFDLLANAGPAGVVHKNFFHRAVRPGYIPKKVRPEICWRLLGVMNGNRPPPVVSWEFLGELDVALRNLFFYLVNRPFSKYLNPGARGVGVCGVCVPVSVGLIAGALFFRHDHRYVFFPWISGALRLLGQRRWYANFSAGKEAIGPALLMALNYGGR